MQLTKGQWILNTHDGWGLGTLTRVNQAGPKAAYVHFDIPFKQRGRGMRRQPVTYECEIVIDPWQAAAFAAARRQLWVDHGKPGTFDVGNYNYSRSLRELIDRMFGGE